uniref:Uncharacterized protein n=1 Tax=Syphacia muris TaxID=451379 RepID=A0A0N5ACC6_9BILA
MGSSQSPDRLTERRENSQSIEKSKDSVEVTDDTLKGLEASTEQLSIDDNFELSAREKEIPATSSIRNSVINTQLSTPNSKQLRNPMGMKFSGDFDVSMLSVGTPGLERLSDRVKQFDFGAVPSSSADVSVSSCSINDSCASPEKPIHLVSRFEKAPTPELLLAKRHIIHPEKPIGGIRRSTRNRVKRLRRWLGEEPIYDRDKEGNLELIGVKTVKITDPFLRRYHSASMGEAVEQRLKKQSCHFLNSKNAGDTYREADEAKMGP